MKGFSKSWNKSRLPRKQRKYRYKAPLHIKSAMLCSHLSKELRQKSGRRSLRVRKDDKVRVMVGQFKNREGKVTRVDTKRQKLYIENVEMAKKDGSKAFYPVDASNVMIIELNMDDKKRKVKK
jgi:large subunit ribosomal protein L24